MNPSDETALTVVRLRILKYVAEHGLESIFRESGEEDKEYFPHYDMPKELSYLNLSEDQLFRELRALKNRGYLTVDRDVRAVDSAEYDVIWSVTDAGRKICEDTTV